MCLILFKLCVTRDVVNLWRGSNPDHNANKTVADVALALKQYKQITQQPQNTATSRARYMIFAGFFFYISCDCFIYFSGGKPTYRSFHTCMENSPKF